MKGLKSVSVYILLFFVCVSALGMLSYKNHPVSKTDDPVTLAEFKRVTSDSVNPVLVYFHASWCAVCRKVGPVIDEVKAEYGDKMVLLKVDTERDKEITEEMEIDALPVLMLYRKGVRQWIHVGTIDKVKLKSQIGK